MFAPEMGLFFLFPRFFFFFLWNYWWLCHRIFVAKEICPFHSLCIDLVWKSLHWWRFSPENILFCWAITFKINSLLLCSCIQRYISSGFRSCFEFHQTWWIKLSYKKHILKFKISYFDYQLFSMCIIKPIIPGNIFSQRYIILDSETILEYLKSKSCDTLCHWEIINFQV